MKALFVLCAFLGAAMLALAVVALGFCIVLLLWQWLTEQIYLAGLRLRRKGKHP